MSKNIKEMSKNIKEKVEMSKNIKEKVEMSKNIKEKVEMSIKDSDSDLSSSSISEENSEEEEEYFKNKGEIVDPRVKQTVKEMLEARGYTITQEVQEDEVKSLIGSKQNCDNIHVLFATDYAGGEEIKFNIKIVNFYLSYISKSKLEKVIIIHQGKTPSAKVIETLKNYSTVKKVKIEIFAQRTLKYNPTKHRLVPRHEAMTKENSRIFKEKYGDSFNKIKIEDPISRFYGYEKGDVIIIHRKDRPVNYRIVI